LIFNIIARKVALWKVAQHFEF